MFNKENEKINIFLHIPKTAGSTIISILAKNYSPAEKLDCYSDYPGFLNKIQEMDKVKCVHGHFEFGIHSHFQKPFSYATMLRHPIDRVISTYYYMMRSRTHHLYSTVSTMSIKEFVASEDSGINHSVSNLQTALLSGTYPPDLKEAKRNLKQYFNVVGITERFDQSLFLLTKEFNLNNVTYTKENVTANRPKVEQHSKEVLDIIIQKNRLDLELYEYANQLLTKKIEKLDPLTRQEMNDFLTKT